MHGRSWFNVAVWSAIGSMVFVSIVALLPFGLATTVLIAGAIVFVIVLVRNPRFWHRRTAAALLTSWMSISALGGLKVTALWGDTGFAHVLLTEVGWPFHLGVATLTSLLLWFDHSQNAASIERVVNLETLPQSERVGVALAAIQSKQKFFPIDTGNLTTSQQFELAKEQVRVEEKRTFRFAGLSCIMIIALGAFLLHLLRPAGATQSIENNSGIAIGPHSTINLAPQTEKTPKLTFRNTRMDTEKCMWEQIGTFYYPHAPIMNPLTGEPWNLGGPYKGKPRTNYPMGSHQLWPLSETGGKREVDRSLDPILDITLVNDGTAASVISEIGIVPVAAWTAPKGPPWAGKIEVLDCYDLKITSFEPGEHVRLVLPDPIHVSPDGSCRVKLLLSNYARGVKRNESALVLYVIADNQEVRSAEIYLGLHEFYGDED